MKCKQAQVQMVFLIAFISIVLLFTMIFGYKVISNLKKSGQRAQTTQFYINLKSRISEISEMNEFSEKVYVKVPEKTKYMCFVDKSLLDDKNFREIYCDYSVVYDPYYGEKSYVCSIIKEGVEKNIFLFPNLESFYIENIFVGEGVYCFPTTKEEVALFLSSVGLGTYLEEIPPETRFCKDDKECSENEFCSDKGVCKKKCSSDEECNPFVCNYTGLCVECIDNSNCKQGVCDTNTNKCVECSNDNHCSGTQKCYNNKCIELHCEKRFNNSQTYCKDTGICVCNITNHEIKSECKPCEEGVCSDGVCTRTCGDGIINSLEECDGTNLNGKKCSDLKDSFGYNFISGNLKCNDKCKFDTSECISYVTNYTLNTNYKNIACFKQNPININSYSECRNFFNHTLKVLCKGNISNCDPLLSGLINQFCPGDNGPQPQPNFVDLIIFKIYHNLKPISSNLETYSIASIFNAGNLIISEDLKNKAKYNGFYYEYDFVCYELCDNSKIKLIIDNTYKKLLDIQVSDADLSIECDICNTWLNNYKCKYDCWGGTVTDEYCPKTNSASNMYCCFDNS